jgi:hypothetical protein
MFCWNRAVISKKPFYSMDFVLRAIDIDTHSRNFTSGFGGAENNMIAIVGLIF